MIFHLILILKNNVGYHIDKEYFMVFGFRISFKKTSGTCVVFHNLMN